MSSSFGLSFGNAWGNAWGAVGAAGALFASGKKKRFIWVGDAPKKPKHLAKLIVKQIKVSSRIESTQYMGIKEEIDDMTAIRLAASEIFNAAQAANIAIQSALKTAAIEMAFKEIKKQKDEETCLILMMA